MASGSIRSLAIVGLACSVLVVAPAALTQQKPPVPLKPSAPPAPWPDAKVIEQKRKAAQDRALFRSKAPLEFTLTANFKAVNNERDPESTRTFPATIEFAKDDGTKASMPLKIRLRGHSRRKICTFAPLRLEFDKALTKGTVFDGHGPIKLGTHCSNDWSEIIAREYAAYQIYNLLTPRSFRVRQARATYVDADSKKVIATKYAMFLEDDDDVAERLSGRISELQGLTFNRVDAETITMMTVFAYMIGATDMSLITQHNVQVVTTPEGLRFPVLYDFDYSGLVDAGYATPGSGLGLVTVRDRMYRGPCRTAAEFEPFFEKTRAIKGDVYKILEALEVDAKYLAGAKAFMDKYYKTIDSPAEVKKAFIDPCKGRPYM